jgi:hypothetical protein
LRKGINRVQITELDKKRVSTFAGHSGFLKVIRSMSSDELTAYKRFIFNSPELMKGKYARLTIHNISQVLRERVGT